MLEMKKRLKLESLVTRGALGPKNKRIYFGCPSSLLHAKYAQLNCTTFQQITAIIAATIM